MFNLSTLFGQAILDLLLIVIFSSLHIDLCQFKRHWKLLKNAVDIRQKSSVPLRYSRLRKTSLSCFCSSTMFIYAFQTFSSKFKFISSSTEWFVDNRMFNGRSESNSWLSWICFSTSADSRSKNLQLFCFVVFQQNKSTILLARSELADASATAQKWNEAKFNFYLFSLSTGSWARDRWKSSVSLIFSIFRLLRKCFVSFERMFFRYKEKNFFWSSWD